MGIKEYFYKGEKIIERDGMFYAYVLKEGDKVKVLCQGADNRGKIKLSMKRVNQETGEIIELPEPERKERHHDHDKKREEKPADVAPEATEQPVAEEKTQE